MQVIVKGQNFHVSDSLKDLSSKKLQKVQRYFDRIQTLEIEFSEEHNPRIADKFKVEVTLTTKAHVLRAHANGPDPTSAVDRVLDKLESQVKRLKGKIVRRGRNARTSNSAKGVVASPFRGAEGSPIRGGLNGADVPIESLRDLGEGEPHITRVKRFVLKPMTAGEAVLQMESLGHDFYLFVNAESDQAGVVYRRSDGSFGLIEPS